eukprot:430023-Rhodomonas_salina.5
MMTTLTSGSEFPTRSAWCGCTTRSSMTFMSSLLGRETSTSPSVTCKSKEREPPSSRIKDT